MLSKVLRYTPFSNNAMDSRTHSMVMCLKKFFEHRFVIAAKSGSQVQLIVRTSLKLVGYKNLRNLGQLIGRNELVNSSNLMLTCPSNK